jgi:uncharacterized protein YycO
MAGIKLRFVCEKAISSQVISWFSAGHFSHVDVALDDGTYLGVRSDCNPGVQIRPTNYIQAAGQGIAHEMIMRVPCSDAQQAAFYKFLYAQIGKPYDNEAIWAFAFNRNWRRTDSWICSELVCGAEEKGGILLPLYLAANKIVPVACAFVNSAIGGVVLLDTLTG